jgi:hypothetical protein
MEKPNTTYWSILENGKTALLNFSGRRATVQLAHGKVVNIAPYEMAMEWWIKCGLRSLRALTATEPSGITSGRPVSARLPDNARSRSMKAPPVTESRAAPHLLAIKLDDSREVPALAVVRCLATTTPRCELERARDSGKCKLTRLGGERRGRSSFTSTPLAVPRTRRLGGLKCVGAWATRISRPASSHQSGTPARCNSLPRSLISAWRSRKA